MTLIEYQYFAPLANARGHFRSLTVPEPFKIERWQRARMVKLWRQLAWLPKLEIEVQTEDREVVPHDYDVGHVVVATLRRTSINEGADWLSRIHGLDKLEDLLKERLRLVGLYLCGQPELAASYWYTVEDRKPELAYGGMSTTSIRAFPTTPNQNTIRATNEFSRVRKLPLSPDYLQTALEHWEESHRSKQKHLEFFSLMVALETLFNVGAQDIRYRVSRSVAVLLGDDADESDYIFEVVKEAYDVRSKLVHTGKPKGLDKVWLWHLRRIVQASILKMLELQLPKDEISARLTRLGFGEGARVTANPSIERTGLRPAAHVKR